MPPATATSRSPARIAASMMPDGADARRADLVDRLRRDLLGDAGLDLGLARGDLPLAGLEHGAHDDVLDLLGLDLGALERGLDGDPAELGGLERGEPAAQLADGVRAALRMTVLDMWFLPAGVFSPEGRITLLRSRANLTDRHERALHTDLPAQTDADTIAVGVFEDEGIAHDVDGGAAGARRQRRGAPRPAQARGHARRRQALDPRRAGPARRVRPERARVAAAVAAGRAPASSARARCAGRCPTTSTGGHVAALVEGTLLAAYAYRAYKTGGDDDAGRLDTLLVSAHDDVGDAVHAAHVGAEAANAARDLQNTPANDLTPTRLADAARDDRREPQRADVRGAGAGARSRKPAWARSRRSRAAPTRSRR